MFAHQGLGAEAKARRVLGFDAAEHADPPAQVAGIVAVRERLILYYYYADYSLPNSTRHLSLVKGSGALHDGDQVRIINVATGQFLVPRDGHLTTVATASADDLWALLRTR